MEMVTTLESDLKPVEKARVDALAKAAEMKKTRGVDSTAFKNAKREFGRQTELLEQQEHLVDKARETAFHVKRYRNYEKQMELTKQTNDTLKAMEARGLSEVEAARLIAEGQQLAQNLEGACTNLRLKDAWSKEAIFQYNTGETLDDEIDAYLGESGEGQATESVDRLDQEIDEELMRA